MDIWLLFHHAKTTQWVDVKLCMNTAEMTKVFTIL